MERDQSRLTQGRIFFLAMLLVLGIGLHAGVDAQSNTDGNISGTVRDPQGAIVPKAEVLILEERTGFSRTVTANSTRAVPDLIHS